MKNNKLMIIATVIIYGLVSGLGNILSYYLIITVFHGNYIVFMLSSLFIQLILTLIAILALKRVHCNILSLFGKVEKGTFKLMIPHFLLLIGVIIEILTHFTGIHPVIRNTIIISLFTTLFVGISEELLFRGAVLTVFKENNTRKGMFMSALIFSLFHISNLFILSTQPLAGAIIGVLAQVVSTFIFGMFASTVAVKQKTLIPLILYHWLWDFMTEASQLMNVSSLMSSLNIILNLIMAIIIWKKYFKPQKKSKRIAPRT